MAARSAARERRLDRLKALVCDGGVRLARRRGRCTAGLPAAAACAALAAALAPSSLFGADRWPIGLSQHGTRIEALRVAAGADRAPTVLLVGGLTGPGSPASTITAEVERYDALPADDRPFHLLAVAAANPEGNALVFPPIGNAYREHAESHALWRWIGLQAPDLVLVVGDDDAGLAKALSDEVVAGVGAIPARGVAARAPLLTTVPEDLAASDARVEIERRRARSPRALAEELASIYGRDFDRVIYVPGMALLAHLRLGNLEHVQRLAAPYANGSRDSFGDPARRLGLSLYLAGHLVFAELAEQTGNPAYLRLAESAAAFAFTDDGEMLEAMPGHGEMSDSIFMGTAILAAVGRLTGEPRYFDMAARHVAYMNALVLRDDGLYRHSPLTDAAWGRGNAFSALGYALTLTEFPADHPERPRLLRDYRGFMTTLAGFQNEDGAWRQVVDVPGAYSETSATAMIGFSMLRGVREGWLDARTFQPHVQRAWNAVLTRSGKDGAFIDVSESTNKQESLEAYLHREALLGRDPRTGGMVMLFAVEMADAG